MSPVDASPPDTPTKIGGYRVIRRLATGGTSDVLLARAEGPHGFERVVVLKLLLAHLREDESFEKMFAREAAAYARLSHPAIVKLYDFFSDRGQLVMALEFVDGLPLNKLRALLKAQPRAAQVGRTHPPGELDYRASLFIASRIFSALAAAHGARDTESGEFAPVIHRDVNPSNVLVPWDGHVKLADFGIAKVAGMQSDTKAGYIKGTYGYMAPEQVRGEAVTPRTDVYAAMLLLWEMLAHRKAIQRGALPDIEVLRAMAEPSFPSLDVLRPDLPAALREVVKRGLEPQADRRAIFADEVVAVLKSVANLDEGRALLVDTLAIARPPQASEDLEKTLTSPPRASLASFGDTTLVNDAPGAADTQPVAALNIAELADVPLREERPTLVPATPPPPKPSPPPPAPPRPVAMRTAIGIGRVNLVSREANGAHTTPSPAPVATAPSATHTRPLTPVPPATHTRPLTPVPPAVEARPLPPPPVAIVMKTLALSPPPALAPAPVPAPVPVHAPALVHAPAPVLTPLPPPVSTPPVVPSWPPGTPDGVPSRRGTWLLGAAVGFGVMSLVLVVGLLVLRWRAAPTSASAVASAASSARATSARPPASSASAPVAVAPPATVAPTAIASVAPTTPAAPASSSPASPATTNAPLSATGDIDTSAARPQHRVFVDGRVIGETPGTFHLPCGWHKIRLGSQGSLQSVEVPCGGVLKMSDR